MIMIMIIYFLLKIKIKNLYELQCYNPQKGFKVDRHTA
jgi:hypothetical protein